MRARRLKHNLVFKKTTQLKGPLGGPIELLEDAFPYEIPCDIQSVSEKENFVSEKTKTISELKFVIRYMPGIDTSMKIVFNDLAYKILEISNPFNSNKDLLLYSKVVR